MSFGFMLQGYNILLEIRFVSIIFIAFCLWKGTPKKVAVGVQANFYPFGRIILSDGSSIHECPVTIFFWQGHHLCAGIPPPDRAAWRNSKACVNQSGRSGLKLHNL